MTEIKLTLDDAQADLTLLREAVVGYGDQSQIRALLTRLTLSIEEQVRPAIEEPPEPTEYGSIILARVDERGQRVRWSSPTSQPGWYSEFGAWVGSYQMLCDVEVLRIGMGPEPLAQWESDLLNMETRRDVAAAVLGAMDVDQYLIDAVVNARPR